MLLRNDTTARLFFFPAPDRRGSAVQARCECGWQGPVHVTPPGEFKRREQYKASVEVEAHYCS